MTTLDLLGGAVLTRDGGRAAGLAARRHPLALLALLATAPHRTLSREKIMGLLWPESPDRKARSRLNTCVHNIRRDLGDDVLRSDGEDLRLDVARLACDVLRFREAVEAGDHGEAVRLYRGPFLDGFHLPGAHAFDARVERERADLRRDYLTSLEALATAADAAGDALRAVPFWERVAAADPLDSRIAARLMEALAAAGNQAAALRLAERHAATLREEVGTAPGPGFHAAVARVRAGPDETPDAGGAERRLAVLPFEAVGREPMEGFADGVHADLLNRLSDLSAVAVIARSSVMRLPRRDLPAATIARELGARWILHGQVQFAGDRVHVRAQLADPYEDRQLWGDAYESELRAGDLFEVQGRIAARIAEALEARLTPADRQAVERRPTSDLTAHLLCVQGRGHVDERTEEGLHRAVRYFRAALRRDPSYAIAWAGLADALAILRFYDYKVPNGAPDAWEAARRGVELDPDAGEAHASLGILHSLAQEGAEAREALERAVRLKPSHSEAHMWLAWVLLLMGDAPGALSAGRRALAIDPLAPAYRVYVAEIWLANGNAARALDDARRATEIQPTYGLPHFMRALVLYHLGRGDDALAALDRAQELVPPGGTPSHSDVAALRGVVLAALGRREEARERLDAIRRAGGDLSDPFAEGLVHAALGDAEAAFTAFGRVGTWKAFAVEYLRYFFPEVLGPLRSDARYAKLIAAIDASWGFEG